MDGTAPLQYVLGDYMKHQFYDIAAGLFIPKDAVVNIATSKIRVL